MQINQQYNRINYNSVHNTSFKKDLKLPESYYVVDKIIQRTPLTNREAEIADVIKNDEMEYFSSAGCHIPIENQDTIIKKLNANPKEKSFIKEQLQIYIDYDKAIASNFNLEKACKTLLPRDLYESYQREVKKQEDIKAAKEYLEMVRPAPILK